VNDITVPCKGNAGLDSRLKVVERVAKRSSQCSANTFLHEAPNKIVAIHDLRQFSYTHIHLKNMINIMCLLIVVLPEPKAL